jgi:hypothetical protein
LNRAKLHAKWSRIIIRTAERDKLHFAISRHASPRGGFLFPVQCSPLFEIALVLVRFDHVVGCIIDPDHGVM